MLTREETSRDRFNRRDRRRMNFDFSDDQKFLKAEARKFLDANCPTARVRGVLDDEGKAYDEALWRAVAGQGWLGAAIPEAYGGLGLGHLELCAIAEELGRAAAPIPFASTVYFLAEAVMVAGDEAQKAELLPKIASGEAIGCVATSEGPGALSAATLKATVADGRLSGVKLPVTDGDIATIALVLAKENGKPGLFLVDLTGAGVTREPLQTLDPTRDAARLTFKDAPARRLGAAGAGLELLEQVMDRAAILLAF
jgi:alkylation response protein AidB-like acyl-CoA dehydrogenase